MASYYLLVDLLPLVEDIKRIIKQYLIPTPPVYGDGFVSVPYYVSTFNGERCRSGLFTHDSFYRLYSTTFKGMSVFNENIYTTYHRCGHVCLWQLGTKETSPNTDCFWCKI